METCWYEARDHQFLVRRWPGDGLGLIQMMIEKNFEVILGILFGLGGRGVGATIIRLAISGGLVRASLDCVVSDKIENLLSVLSISDGLERTDAWL